MNTITLALLLAVSVAACDSSAAPACNPAAPAGAWAAESKTLALLADQTFAETTPAGDLHGTWTADASNITFVVSDGSQDAAKPYWVIGDDLVIGETTWSPVCAP